MLLLILISILQSYLVISFRDQIVGVRGKLTCNQKSLQAATVQLIDKNIIGPDIILAENKTSYLGEYEIIGKQKSLLDLSAFLVISHDCDDAIIPCQRTVTLRIPSKYIYRGFVLNGYFEAGTMNMAFRYPKERRSCVDSNYKQLY